MRSKITSYCLLFLFVSSGSLLLAQNQHQNANLYAFWDWQGNNYYNIDQEVEIKQFAGSTFWALVFNFSDNNQGGYIGLQTKGGGDAAGLAIFSIWDAAAAREGDPGSYCIDFGGEGTGKSCRIPLNLSLDHKYRLRIWKLEQETGGIWWGAWIKDTYTGVETFLGKIKVGVGSSLSNNAMNFVEYYGPARACDDVPQSKAIYSAPAANGNDATGQHQYRSNFSRYTIAPCVRGKVTVVGNGVEVIQGGR